jgi:hypothetical protein
MAGSMNRKRVEAMLSGISPMRLIGMWCAGIITIGALSVFLGAALTAGNGELLLIACLMPPAVMLLVWRGAPPATVAELLHSVDHGSKDLHS